MFPILPIGLMSSAKTSLIYTASQSTVYEGLVATYANLNDLNSATGPGTNSGAAEWIKASFGAPVLISAVTVAGGNIPGWGPVALYLNGATFQYSNDDITWTNLITISGVEDSGINLRKKFSFTSVMAQYARLAFNNYLSTTELILE